MNNITKQNSSHNCCLLLPHSYYFCCRQLRELLLCALPKDVLGKGALSQVWHFSM